MGTPRSTWSIWWKKLKWLFFENLIPWKTIQCTGHCQDRKLINKLSWSLTDYSDYCAAVTLGISASTVFAEDVSTETSIDNDSGDELNGFRKIEDGSVVSNTHTAKWRIFTDKARDFFLQACGFFLSLCFSVLFSFIINTT